MWMAESRKGASSTTVLRKKNTLLDEGIDDEFINSWKSISVTENDTVDFSFGTVSKGKNKAFDFGTLDVVFNLDGSFEKLSSFKMDLPDLDFSCLSKKTAKASSCKEESVHENCQKQIDSLNFSFDFKELDGFDVDKSLDIGERSCNQKQDTTAVSSTRVECEGSKIHKAEEKTAFDNSVTKKLPASGNDTSFEVETFQGEHVELEPEVADGSARGARNAEHTNEEVQFEKSCLSGKEVSKGSYQAIHDMPVQIMGMNNAPECISSKLQPEICTMEVELSEVSGGENVTTGKIDSDGTCSENMPQNNSPINLPPPESNHTDRENSGCSTLNEAVDNIQLAKGDLDVKDSSNSDVSRKLLLDTQEFRENQNFNFKLPTAPLCRGSSLTNKVTVKENEVSGNSLQSRTDVVSRPQPHQSSAIRKKIFPLGNNRIDALNQSPATGEGNLCRESLPHNNLATTAPPVVVECEKNFGELCDKSAKVNHSNSCLKTTTQTHCYSELLKLSMVPSRSTTVISTQESKLCSIKTSSKFPNLSSLKISRDFGGKQLLSSAGGEKERQLGESEQNIEAGQRSKSVDIGYCAENAEKQKLLVSNLKRKAVEAPHANSMLFKPLKRVSVSPSGFRKLKEPSEKKLEEQVEGMTPSISHDQLALSTMELETSLVLENHRNIEKAEAYTKELEDICNMLRKKHDEAKEILVRAIVNNNSLLMLNHPIYEQKIQKVQKFAAKLLSKELQTKAA